MATTTKRSFEAGGMTVSIGGGRLLQIFADGHARIININDGPDQIPLVGFHERLSTLRGVDVADAKIGHAATALFDAIAKAPALRSRAAR